MSTVIEHLNSKGFEQKNASSKFVIWLNQTKQKKIQAFLAPVFFNGA